MPLPCALDALPDGVLTFTPAGRIELVAPDGHVVGSVETKTKLAASTQIACEGTKVKLASQPDMRHTLALDLFELDFKDVIEAWQAVDPIERDCRKAREAVSAGRWSDAVAVLDPMNAADPRVARIWTDVGHGASLEAGRSDTAESLAATGIVLHVAEKQPSWPVGEVQSIRLRRAELEVILGDPAGMADLEAIVAEVPSVRGSMAIGDAKWALGDKLGAREAYARAVSLLGSDPAPERIRERCKSCIKK